MLLGIVGKKNSGKDTLSDYLCKHHGFYKDSFAAPLKDICKRMFLLDEKQLEDHTLKETMDERWGLSPREMFQKFGTDFVRSNFGSDFWIRHLEKRMLTRKDDLVVISDVRFENEANWIQKNGGILIRVQPIGEESTPSHHQHEDQHASETEQAGIREDVLVENDKSRGLDHFYDKIESHVIPIIRSMHTDPFQMENVVCKVNHGWDPFLSKHKEELSKILEQVRKDSERKQVYPHPENILRCLWYFPPEETRLVILGQDPYIGEENGVPQACGLSFSVPKSHKHVPPSLQNIYKEILACYPKLCKPSHGCLLRWATEEKILLLNASLTVIKGDSNSHEEHWTDFTDNLIRFISDANKGTIFLLMGRFAGSKAALIDQKKHKVFLTVHPSPLSASRGFFGCGVFKKIDEHLISSFQPPIHWM